MNRIIIPFAVCLFAGVIECNNQTLSSGTTTQGATDTKTVELKAVKLPDLIKAIEAQKGKIVVIDIWATWCPPCQKKFPHFVELHHKYASKGVVFMSLSQDDLEDQAAALKFLQKQKATFANYLNEEPKKAQEYWKFTGIPVALLYDQNSKLHKAFKNDDGKVTIEDIEKEIVKLISK